jgi:hypothetical protein
MNRKQYLAMMILSVLVLALSAQRLTAQTAQKYEGRYDVFVSGKLVGTDTFEVTRGIRYIDNVSWIAAKDEARKLELAYVDGTPSYYRQSLSGVQEFQALVEGEFVSFYEGQAMMGATLMEPASLIVEPAAYSHYTLLMDAYQKDPSPKQHFEVIVPSMQDYIHFEIERHGEERIQTANGTIVAQHYRIAMGKKDVANVWTYQGAVIAIYLAAKNQTIVESTFSGYINQFDSFAKRAM